MKEEPEEARGIREEAEETEEAKKPEQPENLRCCHTDSEISGGYWRSNISDPKQLKSLQKCRTRRQAAQPDVIYFPLHSIPVPVSVPLLQTRALKKDHLLKLKTVI